MDVDASVVSNKHSSSSFYPSKLSTLMESKTSDEHLETPQISRFNHENNVFGLSFKESLKSDLTRLGSLDTQLLTIVDLPDTNNNNTSSGLTSATSNSAANNSTPSCPVATASAPINFYATLQQQQSNNSNNNNNEVNGSKSAPKKSILFRTFSQSEAESQRAAAIAAATAAAAATAQCNAPSTPSAFQTSYSLDSSSSSSSSSSNSSSSSSLSSTSPLSAASYSPSQQLLRVAQSIRSQQQQQQQQRVDNNNNNQRLLKKQPSIGESSMPPLYTPHTSLGSGQSLEVLTNAAAIVAAAAEKAAAYSDSTQTASSGDMLAMTANDSSMNAATNPPATPVTPATPSDKFNSSMSRSSCSSIDDIVTSSDQIFNSPKPKTRRCMALNTDVRKQQIRNSNREAARRCRERRRNYIETLEANIKSLESKQTILTIENVNLSNENASLKKLLTQHGQYCKLNFLNSMQNMTEFSNNVQQSVAAQTQHYQQQQQQQQQQQHVGNGGSGFSADYSMILALDANNNSTAIKAAAAAAAAAAAGTASVGTGGEQTNTLIENPTSGGVDAATTANIKQALNVSDLRGVYFLKGQELKDIVLLNALLARGNTNSSNNSSANNNSIAAQSNKFNMNEANVKQQEESNSFMQQHQ